jgi:hypothetical protein
VLFTNDTPMPKIEISISCNEKTQTDTDFVGENDHSTSAPQKNPIIKVKKIKKKY